MSHHRANLKNAFKTGHKNQDIHIHMQPQKMKTFAAPHTAHAQKIVMHIMHTNQGH